MRKLIALFCTLQREGCFNIRDLGGLRTNDGRTTRRIQEQRLATSFCVVILNYLKSQTIRAANNVLQLNGWIGAILSVILYY